MYANRADGALKDRLLRPSSERSLVLERVTLIDGTGAEPQPNTTLLIQGGTIRRIARNGSDMPSDAERLEVAGSFVTPGMIDCHVHLTGLRTRDPFRRKLEIEKVDAHWRP